ncbi:unnamed protein product [Rhizoctonia solani]|uniref:Uncharacterized protein n=1 Tax=Rhizoctonia solani TaxID=456999 RepID=A0A8H3BZS5_9AGAM|nr:unnamed protein product [Rhizoctonia solani]
MVLQDKNGPHLLLRIKERGREVYDPERAARMTEDPPPQPKGRKIEEIPLFMRKKLPANFPDNSHLPIYGEKELFKGTPNEVALEFKNQGNDFFRARKWWDAREAYTDALEFCPSDPKLQEVLWLNMAAANVELKFWPGVLSPAARAITLNLKSVKAYYRAARALVHYERYEEAIDCCKRVLAFDPYNEVILELMDDPNLGGNVSNKTKTEAARQALEKVYKDNRFIILQNQSLELDPNNFPYFFPAVPKSGRDSKLYCNVNLKYPERNALDVFIGVETGEHVLKLLLNALPGLKPEHAPKNWHCDPYFDPLDMSSENARLVKLQAEQTALKDATGKHPLWDPAYQYLPHNLSIYLETYKRRVIKVEYSHTIGQVLRMVTEKPEDDKICLEGGPIVFNAFRPGCKAEKLWLAGKGRKGFALAHPNYKKRDKGEMLVSGHLRGWTFMCFRDNLEEMSIAARSEIIKNAKVVRDRA